MAVSLNPQAIAEAISFNDARARDLLPLLAQRFGSKLESTFTEPMIRSIAGLQARLGLAVDGKVGRFSRPIIEEELQVPAINLWPPEDATERDRYEHYMAICLSFGYTPASKRPLLLGLRGIRLFGFGTHVVRSRREYDDAFVLLEEGGAVFEFRGATHPFQANSTASPDFNGDGKGDVGMIRPGASIASMPRITTEPAMKRSMCAVSTVMIEYPRTVMLTTTVGSQSTKSKRRKPPPSVSRSCREKALGPVQSYSTQETQGTARSVAKQLRPSTSNCCIRRHHWITSWF